MSAFVRILTVASLLAASACGPEKPAGPHPELQAAVTGQQRPAFVGRDAQARAIWKDEQRFYSENGFQLTWSDGERPSRAMEALVRAIQAAPANGLDPSDYAVDTLAAARDRFDPSTAHEVDLQYTYAYLRYAWHLSRGTRRPEEISKLWHAADRGIDLVASLNGAIESGDIEQALEEIVPKAPQYHGLRGELAKARQRGADTDELQIIAINLDRWRWMPNDLGPRYLFVNIPAFRLDAFENGTSVLDMKVVTGRKEDATPVMRDEMTHVVFSPYWNIPASIVQEEILPALEKNPDYLERQNIEMVSASGESDDVRFRQRPGAGNALGLVKFMFPNNHSIYLHDTPADALFGRMQRAFSHGCVRVEQPIELAQYVLRDQPEWPQDRIETAMHAGTERTVKLSQPIPVYLAYFTAWEEHGTLQTRPDIYGHDRAHLSR
jgi:murein L,D-transpeptidase YcbB/YkuD